MNNLVDPFANENFQYDPNAENRMDLNRASPFTTTELVNIGGNLFYKKQRISTESVHI